MNKLSPSVQDYLKALLKLSAKGDAVHSVDVAAAVGVSRASVSKAMSMLKDLGYVTKEKYGPVFLTQEGRQAAQTVENRNVLITSFLMKVLGVGAEQAKADACLMEHTISTQTAVKLNEYLAEVSTVKA